MTALETPDARVQCPHCFKQVTVRKNGMLRHHTNGRPEWPGSPFSQVCAGTGQDVHLLPATAGQGGGA